MNSPHTPPEIQILLDCLQTRADLELDEMLPLNDWASETPGGELAISQALAKNEILELAIQDIEINVPKTLKRKISSFVEQNIEAVEQPDEPVTVEIAKAQDARRSRRRFTAGIITGLATLLLIGASLNYTRSFYGEMDRDHLASRSLDWLDELDSDQDQWITLANVGNLQISNFPEEVAHYPPSRVAEVKTEYGLATAYELYSQRNTRGILLVLPSSKEFAVKHIGITSDFVDQGSSRHVGIGKNGKQFNILIVECQTPSDFGQFVTKDLRSAVASLLKIVWFLC